MLGKHFCTIELIQDCIKIIYIFDCFLIILARNALNQVDVKLVSVFFLVTKHWGSSYGESFQTVFNGKLLLWILSQQ